MRSEEERDARIEALMEPYRGEVPGAGLLVVEGGVPMLRRACGYADLEGAVRTSSLTNYRLASLTKQFTAAATLLLEEDGRLELDAAAYRWLPALPPAARAITIRQLLTHTSGILDYEELIPPERTLQVDDADVLALLEQEDRTYFEPGARYRYSNSGYVLLGLVLSAAAQTEFRELIESRIFVPLGMRTSVVHREGISTVSHRAFGYTAQESSWRRTDQDLTSATLGDGGIYSSIEDLERWVLALDEERLLRPESWRSAFAPAVHTDLRGTAYGFGWQISGDTVWHSGETVGFRNVIVRFLADRLTVVLLTNRNGPEPYATALAIAAAFQDSPRET